MIAFCASSSVGQLNPYFKHALNALGHTEFAFFIEKRGLIDYFHTVGLENWGLFQFILIGIAARGNDFFAVVIDHL